MNRRKQTKKYKNIEWIILFSTFAAVTLVLLLSPAFRKNTLKTSAQKLLLSTPSSAIEETPKTRLLTVPTICQYPELPTGCESVAAVMALQFYGIDVSAEEFAGNWLVCDDNFSEKAGELYGPDPNEVFVGNPFSKHSYGCFASPITAAINKNCADCHAETLSGISLENLCAEYIASDQPVLIWATMSMKESKPGKTWRLPDGSAFTWISGEHCLVLVGYSENSYYLNDPQTGTIVSYEKSLVEKRYADLGMQAVLLLPADI